MKVLSRWSVSAGVLAVLVAGATSACPTWSACVGLNLTEWLDLSQQMAVEYRREEVLIDQVRRTHRILRTKTQIADDLCAGRLTLLEAAARFRDLGGEGAAVYLNWSRQHEPHQTDDERWCHQVILFLQRPDDECPSPADQFEAELAERRAQGPLHLPD